LVFQNRRSDQIANYKKEQEHVHHYALAKYDIDEIDIEKENK
jgi:hypothetical protein